MKKLGAVLCILILFSGVSFGQSVSIMGGLTFPTGDFGDLYDTGIGVSGIFEYALGPSLAITGKAGYLRWSDSVQEVGVSVDHSMTSIPLLGGVRFYFAPGDLSPYVSAEAGLHMTSWEVSGGGMSFSDSESYFGFGVGGGVLFSIGTSLYLDANVKYNSIDPGEDSGDFISLFVGVRFPL